MEPRLLENSDQNAYLLFRAQKGLKSKGLFDKPEYQKRLMYEWEIICKKNYSGYFLVVSDYVSWAKAQGIPVGPARGSGGGSLVAYAAGIIDVDPVKNGLFFERFLNPERSSMPDFDIDFSKSRVAEVVTYVVNKYGKDYTARIGNVGTMKSRSSVRDVARVLGHTTEEIDTYGKLIPEEGRGGTGDNAVTVNLCLNPTPEFLEHYGKDLQRFKAAYQRDSKFQEVINIAARIEGLAKSAGISGAGVLISPVSLSRTIPLRSIQNSEKEKVEADTEGGSLADVDIAIADWTIKAVEELGLVKFDFLSLDTLDVIDDAMKRIDEDLGVKIDWDNVSDTDFETFELLSAGNTYGVFQLTEPWMADFCKKFKPQSISDISTISALYRPGPKDNGMVDSILEVRRTGKANRYPIPVVNEILASTDGVLTYQEQILEIAVKVAGYSLAQADMLRRAMGKKDKVVMMAERDRFISGAQSVAKASVKDAIELFDIIQKFSDYCFNLSHSFAYSIISFRCAYLKTHYPVHFYAADLTSKAGKSFEKMLPCLNDARQNGIKILPPDVNRSVLNFSVYGENSVLFGFGGIKSLGSNTIEALIESRKARQFINLYDFCIQVEDFKVNINHIKQLCFAGAFDTIEPEMNRAEMFAYVEQLITALKKEKDRARAKPNQMTLFSMNEVAPVLVDRPRLDFSFEEKLRLEREIIGVYLSGSPLDPFIGIKGSGEFQDISSLSGSTPWANLFGFITSRRDFMTKNGAACEIILEDRSGQVPVFVWGDRLPSLNELLFEGNVVLVSGRVSTSRGLSVSANSIIKAESKVREHLDRVVVKHLSPRMIRLLSQIPKGSIPVDYELDRTFRYRLGMLDITLDTLRKINELDAV